MLRRHLLGGDVRRLELRLDAVMATATWWPMTVGCSYLERGMMITRQKVRMQAPVNTINLPSAYTVPSYSGFVR
jgi:hypothetical protein